MRAVVMREFGPPSVLRLEEVAEPEGEALVEVAFASVTFVETMVRAGRPPHSSLAPALPAILGNGVAGTWTVRASSRPPAGSAATPSGRRSRARG